MEESKKLIYNDNEGKLTQEEIFQLSENEFYDYLSSQDDESISDDEIILNYKKGTEELIQEIRSFHDNMAALAMNNKISLKNKFSFIMDLLNAENREEVLPLLVCFICDMDYIFNLKKIIVKEKSKRNLARYLRLKEKMEDFLEKLKFIKKQEKAYENFIKQVLKKDEIINGEELSNENKKILKDLFIKYVKIDIDEKCFDENLEHIHKFLTSTEERKSIYPNVIFKVFTTYTKKFCKNTFIITNKNFLNYKPYKVHGNNYKNFKTNENYIRLFFELCNEFCEEKYLRLNLFVFQKCSELGKWYWLQDSKNVDFCYSYDSLFDTSYSKYNSIFPDESKYYMKENSCRIICFNEEKDGKEVTKEIREYDYIDQLIEEHIKEIVKDKREYLKEFLKGKKSANIYVEKIADKIMEYADEDLQKDFYFRRNFYWEMEGAFREISDGEIRRKAVEFIRVTVAVSTTTGTA